jgi:hypothetical protein
MKKSLQLFSLFVMLLIFSSCYKYSTDDLNRTTNQTNTGIDSLYLNKTLEVDYDNSNQIVDSIETTYTYDAQKRLSKMFYNNFTLGQNNENGLFYNGSTSMPYKMYDYDFSDTVWHFYTYNSNNKLIMDSSIFILSNITVTNKKTFTYAANKVYIKNRSFYTASNFGVDDYDDTATLNTAGQVISYVQWVAPTLLTPAKKSFDININYDSKLSAYNKLPFDKLFYIDSYFLNYYPTVNNMLTSSGVEDRGGVLSNIGYSKSYIYNAQNLPIQSNEVYTNFGVTTGKTKYTYIAL